MLTSAVLRLTFWWRAIFSHRGSSKSLPFTSLLISSTIPTLSVCHQDWDFNFVPPSPDAVMSWHYVLRQALRVCSAVALWQPASQTIFEKVKDYTGALASITASHLWPFPHGPALHERWSARSLRASVVLTSPSTLLPTFQGIASESLETRLFWLTCPLAEKRAAAKGKMQTKKNVLCSLIIYLG